MSTARIAASGPASIQAHASLDKALLACGIASSAIYVIATIVGALGWPSYSSFSQTISELAAIDAPSRPTVVPLASSSFGPRFRAFSFIMIALMLVMGALTAMQAPHVPVNLPTPWLGVRERINVYGFLLWIAVLAVALWRRTEPVRLMRRHARPSP